MKTMQIARFAVLAGALAVSASTGLIGSGVAYADDKGVKVDFATQIAPILKDSCVRCHSLNNPRKKAAAKLQLDDKAAAMAGGKSGVSIVPGKSKESLLYQVLLGPVKKGDQELDAMPKTKKGGKFTPLSQDKIDLIAKWIDQGANWPN